MLNTGTISYFFNGSPLKKYEMVPVFGINKENVDKFAAGCSY